jgi:hypothetical protein
MQRDVNNSARLNEAVVTALITQPIDQNYEFFEKTFMDVGQWVSNGSIGDYNWRFYGNIVASDRDHWLQYCDRISNTIPAHYRSDFFQDEFAHVRSKSFKK